MNIVISSATNESSAYIMAVKAMSLAGNNFQVIILDELHGQALKEAEESLHKAAELEEQQMRLALASISVTTLKLCDAADLLSKIIDYTAHTMEEVDDYFRECSEAVLRERRTFLRAMGTRSGPTSKDYRYASHAKGCDRARSAGYKVRHL
jgi:hypothetical protein